MLRDEDVRVDVGRASHGGDFMRLVHLPTGIERTHSGPMRGLNQREVRLRLLKEIEAELRERGLTQYFVKYD